MLYAFSIKDDKSDAFAAPFFMAAKGLAVRAFGDLAADSSTEVGRHPEDFRLFYLGFFDPRTATLVSEQLELMSSGSDWKGAPRALHSA